MKCKDRMHDIVKNEVESAGEATWKEMMTRSFTKMDKEVVEYSRGGGGAPTADCRCELQTPQCDAVGSTAVVAVVTPNEIIVSNCGDSRAVLCRNGVAIPLSTDHKVCAKSIPHMVLAGFIPNRFSKFVFVFVCSRIDPMNSIGLKKLVVVLSIGMVQEFLEFWPCLEQLVSHFDLF